MSTARRAVDGGSILTIFILALLLIPSRLTVAALGGAGSPARLLGIAILGWWVFDLLYIRRDREQRTPLRTYYFVMVAAFLASYVAATLRPVDGTEGSSADLGLLVLLSWGGVLLVASEGLPTLDRLDSLLRRIVFLGGVVATIGLIQFTTGETLVDTISIPGLSNSQALGTITSREGFNRPPGTSIHAIEYGSVITMILPLAIHLAMNDKTRSVVRRSYPVVVMAFACVTSISRSALVCALVGVGLLSLAWRPAVRLGALVLALMFSAVIFVTIPGILGSMAGLFTNISADSSAQSRTDSYGFAMEFVQRSPWVGRGFSTFLPIYRIFDNQYLTLMVEVGVLGLLAVLALQLRSLMCALAVRRRAEDPVLSQLGQAMFASVAAGCVGMALFDGFSFPMAAGLLFLMMGLSGCLHRLVIGPVVSGRAATTEAVTATGPAPEDDETVAAAPAPMPETAGVRAGSTTSRSAR